MSTRRPTYAEVRDRWTKKRDGSPSAEHGTGRRWVVEYYEPGKTRVTRESFAVKAAAEHRARELNNQIDTGAGPVGLRGDMTVAEWVGRWFELAGYEKPNTRRTREGIFRLHVTPTLGEIRLAHLERHHIVELTKRWAAEGAAVGTREHRLTVVNVCLNAAVADRRLVSNPAAGVKVPRVQVAPSRARMTDDEAVRVLNGVPARFRLFVRLALMTGMRVSELCGLTHGQIRYLPNGEAVIKVDRQLAASDGGRVELFATTKGPRSDRDVKIDADSAAMIVDHESTFGHGPSDLVFAGGSRSAVFTQSSAASLMTDHIHPILGAERQLELGAWHGFRRYHASACRDAGRSAAYTAKRLGHTVAQLEKTYSLTFDEADATDLATIAAPLNRPRLTVVTSA